MRTVVVGAGVTGLAASLLLARSGHEVTLVERHPRTAPLLRGFSRQGLHFDTGFHIGGGLQPGGTLWQWLRVLGVADALHPLPLRPDSAALFVFPDGQRFGLPLGQQALIDRVDRDFPGHAAQVAELLQAMQRTLRTSPYMHAPTEAELAASDSGHSGLLSRLAGLPPVLATMLASYTLLYGVEPAAVDWKTFSVVAGPFVTTTHTLEGGGQRLAQVLDTAARAAGVRVRCGHAVTAVETGANQAIDGLRLDNGDRLACEACLFTGHPRQLAGLAPEGALRGAYLRHLAELVETPAPFLVFAQTRRDVLDRRSLYLPGGFEPESLFEQGGVEAQTLYMTCGEAHADGRRPLVGVMTCPAELAETPARPLRQALAGRLLDRVRRQVPELDDVELVETATPATMRRWIYGSTGSLYGARHGMADGQLAPLTRIRGLLLAGQSVLLPGILGGIISAAVAVNLINGTPFLFEEFARCAKSE